MQERSAELEGYALAHAQMCGNDSELNPFSVLPHLDGGAFLINLWEYADPTGEVEFTSLANRFYSDLAKDDYRNGYSPASFSNDIYDRRYRELYAYFQVNL